MQRLGFFAQGAVFLPERDAVHKIDRSPSHAGVET
jgi:hypothetical protein